jgi:hypothetical protein
LLPEENVLLGSWKEAKKILSSIGMEYQIVHACVNDCMLFHGNNAHLTECSTCEEAHSSDAYREGAQEISKVVSHYSSLAAHVSMYRLAELMVWHKEHRS